MKRFDRFISVRSRALARGTSRRSFLGRMGALLLGGAAVPLLPVSRVGAGGRVASPHEPDSSRPEGNPEDCEYWRYCGIDGFLASCCGGSHTSCPPGTEMSPVTWIGTCRNPHDGTEYVISYNDCCGKSSCGRCLCNRNDDDRPVYRPSANNDINWCVGTSNNIYNCSTAVLLGPGSQ